MSPYQPGDWVILDGRKYPVKIVYLLDELAIFEYWDSDGSTTECHGRVEIIRMAKKSDFDKLILDTSQHILDVETSIAEIERVQKEISL